MRNVTFILGAPRSGTTWLAKIFDSHPDVGYLHEPDLTIRDDSIPMFCPAEDVDRHAAAMRAFIVRLLANRAVRTLCKPPIFRKSNENAGSHVVRRGAAHALRVADMILPAFLKRRLTVPPLWPDAMDAPHQVIKSISALGRVGLIRRAVPDSPLILIIRNPFGQVASCVQGIVGDRFENKPQQGRWFDNRWIDTAQARRHGLTHNMLARMPLVSQLAWEWVVMNEKAVDDLANDPLARVIRYADMIDDTIGEVRSLFTFAGLSWATATERFIRDSISHTGPDQYYDVYRNARAAKEKWRMVLNADEKIQVFEIMRETPIGRLWPELVCDRQAVLIGANA